MRKFLWLFMLAASPLCGQVSQPPIVAYNINNTLYIDGAKYNSSPDLGATINAMVTALPASGGTIVDNSPTAATISTTISDGGKVVKFVFGAVSITCSAQCIRLETSGSSIQGAGDQSAFTISSGLSFSTPPILAESSVESTGLYDINIDGLNIVNGRNSNVGMIQCQNCVRSHISNILYDGTSDNQYFGLGVEVWDGFSDEIDNIRCVNSQYGICIGATAANFNQSNVIIHNTLGTFMTAVALNYAVNATSPNLMDTIKLQGTSNAWSGGPVAQQGFTTVSGSHLVGVTTLNVASGAACFGGPMATRPIWIGQAVSSNDVEFNMVTNIATNAITLMFPTRIAHANGERVLCGNVGIAAEGNIQEMSIDTPHIEGVGTGIDMQGVYDATIISPTLAGTTSMGSPVGDGIRMDGDWGVTINLPKFSEFTNEINLTSTTGAWGTPSRGITLIGKFNNSPTSTNLGLVNNTGSNGTGLVSLYDTCMGEVQTGECVGIPGIATANSLFAASLTDSGANAFGSIQTSNAAACETSFGATTLSGASTNTGLNCLPVNSVIDMVVYRITTTITTATNFTIGDSGSATRYCGTQSTLTAGTTGLCSAAGYYLNTSALPLKITPNMSPGAGAIRLIVYYHTWTAPTS